MILQHKETARETLPDGERREPDRRRNSVVNWILALLTVPVAALIMIFAVGATMSMAACSSNCPDLGPHGLLFGILFYGAPVVAGLTVIASFFTASRPRGFAVPLIGLALLLADFAAIAMAF